MAIALDHKLACRWVRGGEPDELAHEDVVCGPKARSFLKGALGGLDGVIQRRSGEHSLLLAPALYVFQDGFD